MRATLMGWPVCPVDPSTFLVGAAGFEPATPSSQTRCATGLRYAPNIRVNRMPAPWRSMREILGPFFPFTLRKPHHRALERRPGVLECPASVEVARVVPDHRIDERHRHLERVAVPTVAVEQMHPPLAVFRHRQQTETQRDAIRAGERKGERP